MKTIEGINETYEIEEAAIERLGVLTGIVERAFAETGLEFRPGTAFVAALGLSVGLPDLCRNWLGLFLSDSPQEQRDAFAMLCSRLAMHMGRAVIDIQTIKAAGEVAL